MTEDGIQLETQRVKIMNKILIATEANNRTGIKMPNQCVNCK
jgi:hypothetical protein